MKERNVREKLGWILGIVAAVMMLALYFVGGHFGYLMGRACARESAYSDDVVEAVIALYEMDYGKKVNETIFGDDILYLVLEDGTVETLVLKETEKCRFEWVMNE